MFSSSLMAAPKRSKIMLVGAEVQKQACLKFSVYIGTEWWARLDYKRKNGVKVLHEY